MVNYTVTVNPKDNTKYNPLHEEINNCRCFGLDFKVGERGRFFVELEDGYHEIHTSSVITVDKTDSNTTVETLNTVYIFEKI